MSSATSAMQKLTVLLALYGVFTVWTIWKLWLRPDKNVDHRIYSVGVRGFTLLWILTIVLFQFSPSGHLSLGVLVSLALVTLPLCLWGGYFFGWAVVVVYPRGTGK
jgi:hypothetical protein